MRVAVITPPMPVVSLEEAKAQLHVDGDCDDVLIGGMLAAATAFLDGPDGWLGRALGRQTLEVAGDLFAWRSIVLPFPPVTSIVSVKYDDAYGTEQVLAPASYVLRGSAVTPLWGTSWPVPRRDDEPVRVRYQAGYGPVPAPIRVAILLMVEAMYDNAAGAATIPPAAGTLLAPFRLFA